MADVTVLLQKLREIDASINPPEEHAVLQHAHMDKFTVNRIRLAGVIKKIRQEIQETQPGHKDHVKSKLKEARLLGKELEKIHKKELKDLDDKESENREKVLSMMHLHFEYLESQLISVSTSSSHSSSHSCEDSDQATGFTLSVNIKKQPLLIELDANEFASVLANEEKIERGLENLHQGVQRLQQLAELKSERKMDNAPTSRMTIARTPEYSQVEYTSGHTDTKNKARTRALTKRKSPINFCIDCLFFITFVALSIGMYFALTK